MYCISVFFDYLIYKVICLKVYKALFLIFSPHSKYLLHIIYRWFIEYHKKSIKLVCSIDCIDYLK